MSRRGRGHLKTALISAPRVHESSTPLKEWSQRTETEAAGQKMGGRRKELSIYLGIGDEMEGSSIEDWRDSAEVLSDVHVGCYDNSYYCTTVFHISVPGSADAEGASCKQVRARGLQKIIEGEAQSKHESNRSLTVDESGDLVIPRRKRMGSVERFGDSIIVHHRMATTIPCVGFQVWKGALLLADFVNHKIRTSCDFDNIKAMELGAGLPAIVLARASSLVFITDRDPDILDNCYRNVLANFHTFRYGEAAARVRKLDWQESWPPCTSCQNTKQLLRSMDGISYAWNEQDLQDMEAVQVLLAADVIYSNELTDLFFKLLNYLIPPNSSKVLYLSLEKRYNFTLDDLNVVAHGYEYFRSFFHSKASRPSIELCFFCLAKELRK
ncbi:hypothetical protein O6H91_01G009300 [Diphasiastrum complanatum]|uniref:Uncharacterized protein n=1 Tax=Diphasiastrum complanatum TaxID=34168 RepID=A0ACC2EMX6_DIPCM|nr:hypothetical protein O6H91_01G009300 [Diphasiastrum complanatum]